VTEKRLLAIVGAAERIGNKASEIPKEETEIKSISAINGGDLSALSLPSLAILIRLDERL
jgi:hypothetical protein